MGISVISGAPGGELVIKSGVEMEADAMRGIGYI